MNAGLAARFDAAETFQDAAHYMGQPGRGAPVWRTPDMTVMKANLAPAVPFPQDVLGRMWPLISDLAAGAGAPVEYVATGMLAVAASLIGGKRWVRAWEGYEEPCILWAAVVGDPPRQSARCSATGHACGGRSRRCRGRPSPFQLRAQPWLPHVRNAASRCR